MARKPNLDRMGTSAPKVTQDDLEEDVALLTIASYDEDEIPDDAATDGKRFVAFLTFQELGDKRLYLNKTAATTLVAQFGEDADQWAGKTVPVERVRRKFGKQTFDKVDVVPDEEWDGYLRPVKVAKKAVAKKAKRGK
jgi:hypothetical protein